MRKTSLPCFPLLDKTCWSIYLRPSCLPSACSLGDRFHIHDTGTAAALLAHAYHTAHCIQFNRPRAADLEFLKFTCGIGRVGFLSIRCAEINREIFRGVAEALITHNAW